MRVMWCGSVFNNSLFFYMDIAYHYDLHRDAPRLISSEAISIFNDISHLKALENPSSSDYEVFLSREKDILSSIKKKLGNQNYHCLAISDLIIIECIHSIDVHLIKPLTATAKVFFENSESVMIDAKYYRMKNMAEALWKITKIIEKYDIGYQVRQDVYLPFLETCAIFCKLFMIDISKPIERATKKAKIISITLIAIWIPIIVFIIIYILLNQS